MYEFKESKNDSHSFKKLGLQEHTCEICGKKFECRGEYVYKKVASKSSPTEYYCSWTCYRKGEKCGA